MHICGVNHIPLFLLSANRTPWGKLTENKTIFKILHLCISIYQAPSSSNWLTRLPNITWEKSVKRTLVESDSTPQVCNRMMSHTAAYRNIHVLTKIMQLTIPMDDFIRVMLFLGLCSNLSPTQGNQVHC